MPSLMIHIRGLGMRLASGGRPVTTLDGICLDVPAGQVVAVAGPSGSGQSTLLGLMAGLDRPTAGSIRVAGVEVTALAEDALARFRRDTIGFVFQSHHLIPTLTAAENVAVPLELAGVEGALARAAGLRPRLLLADEPTANLDWATGAQIIELILSLDRQRGSTLVLVTHGPALAAHAGWIVSLRDGRIVGDTDGRPGPPAQRAGPREAA